MRVLVTGREGQIARSLAERAIGIDLICLSSRELDLADPTGIERAIYAVHPDLIINAGAYTAVDRAESEPALAMAINGIGPGILAEAAARIDAPVIHVSTDYVFDGTLDRPYREADPTAPLSNYGRSKLAGEHAVAASGATYAILRTAWVYSAFGANFVKTMLRLAAERDEVSVVADQVGNPTSALDVADGLLAIIAVWRRDPNHGRDRIYHLAGEGSTTWAGFARQVFAESQRRGGPWADVCDIVTAAYPTPARRPANSRLDSALFASVFAYRPPAWATSLETVVSRLVGGMPSAPHTA